MSHIYATCLSFVQWEQRAQMKLCSWNKKTCGPSHCYTLVPTLVYDIKGQAFLTSLAQWTRISFQIESSTLLKCLYSFILALSCDAILWWAAKRHWHGCDKCNINPKPNRIKLIKNQDCDNSMAALTTVVSQVGVAVWFMLFIVILSFFFPFFFFFLVLTKMEVKKCPQVPLSGICKITARAKGTVGDKMRQTMYAWTGKAGMTEYYCKRHILQYILLQ